MKRKLMLVNFVLLLALLINLFPQQARAQENGNSTIYLPYVSTNAQEGAAAMQTISSAAAPTESPLPDRIQLTPLSVLLVGEGDAATLEATIYQGGKAVAGVVAWTVSDPAVLNMDPSDNKAQVTAKVSVGFAVIT